MSTKVENLTSCFYLNEEDVRWRLLGKNFSNYKHKIFKNNYEKQPELAKRCELVLDIIIIINSNWDQARFRIMVLCARINYRFSSLRSQLACQEKMEKP
uniref:Uncharacterized protein n=1 Tax=Romanomermis culicivorax TaxID=13658 RepID=A0A915HYX6_ROMCU